MYVLDGGEQQEASRSEKKKKEESKWGKCTCIILHPQYTNSIWSIYFICCPCRQHWFAGPVIQNSPYPIILFIYFIPSFLFIVIHSSRSLWFCISCVCFCFIFVHACDFSFVSSLFSTVILVFCCHYFILDLCYYIFFVSLIKSSIPMTIGQEKKTIDWLYVLSWTSYMPNTNYNHTYKKLENRSKFINIQWYQKKKSRILKFKNDVKQLEFWFFRRIFMWFLSNKLDRFCTLFLCSNNRSSAAWNLSITYVNKNETQSECTECKTKVIKTSIKIWSYCNTYSISDHTLIKHVKKFAKHSWKKRWNYRSEQSNGQMIHCCCKKISHLIRLLILVSFKIYAKWT